MRKDIYVNGIGKARLENCYTNDTYTISWNFNDPKYDYVPYSVARVEFDDDAWVLHSYFERNNIDRKAEDKELPRELFENIINVLVNDDEVMKMVTKWAKDCLKRLDVSVPRLKEEYETAKLRQKRLSNADFKGIKFKD